MSFGLGLQNKSPLVAFFKWTLMNEQRPLGHSSNATQLYNLCSGWVDLNTMNKGTLDKSEITEVI